MSSLLKQYKSNKDDVKFVLTPVPGPNDNSEWTFHAKLFYVVELLKPEQMEDIHYSIFNEIHNNRNRLNSVDSVAKFLERFNIKSDAVKKAFDSYQIKLKIDAARNLTNKFGIRGTPALLVNKKYKITSDNISSHQDFISNADEIINSIKKGEL